MSDLVLEPGVLTRVRGGDAEDDHAGPVEHGIAGRGFDVGNADRLEFLPEGGYPT